MTRPDETRQRAIHPGPPAPRPRLASLTCHAGPPSSLHVRDRGAELLTVPGRYSVSYLLVGPRTLAVVDVGSAADVPRLEAAVRWLGRSPAELRWVVPSHLHFDHVMGIDACARHFGASVALGEVAEAAVRQGRPLRFPAARRTWRAAVTWPMQGLPFLPLADWRAGLDFGTPWGRNRFTAPLGPTLREGAPLPGLPGWTVLNTPGHAEDEIALLHAEAGLLVAGDTVRNFHGGEWNPLLSDPAAMAATRSRLSTLPVTAVFPGHGPALFGPEVLLHLRTIPWGVP